MPIPHKSEDFVDLEGPANSTPSLLISRGTRKTFLIALALPCHYHEPELLDNDCQGLFLGEKGDYVIPFLRFV